MGALAEKLGSAEDLLLVSLGSAGGGDEVHLLRVWGEEEEVES